MERFSTLNKVRLGIITLGIFILTACAPTFIEKTSETMSQGAYATQAALVAGDFPKAESFNASLLKIIPAPKNPIVVHPIIVKGIQYTLVGQDLSSTTVVFVGSPEYEALVKGGVINDKDEKDYEKSAEEQAINNKNNQDALIAHDKKVTDELSAWHKSWLFDLWLLWQSRWFIVGACVLGFIAICVFAPEALPVVGTILGRIFSFAMSVFETILSFIEGLMPAKTTVSITPPPLPSTTINPTTTTTK